MTEPGLWISAPEVALLPKGGAWDYLKARADATWPAGDLNDQDNIAANYVMAGALTYMRKGGATTYKPKVVNAIKAWAIAGNVDSLALFRFAGTMVRAADIVGMDPDTVVASTETWGEWCTRIIDDPVGDHPSWNSISGTAEIAPNNYGAYARDAMAALAIYNGDAVAQQAVYDYTARWLGDLSKPNTFPNPTAEGEAQGWYTATGFNAGANAHYLAAQGVINPYVLGDSISATSKAGANAEDASRGGGPPKAIGSGINYQLGALDGTIAAAIMLKRAGLGNLFDVGTEAIKRNAKKVHADSSSSTWHALFKNIPHVINHVYGTALPKVSAPTGRSLAYCDWLTQNPNWPH